MRCPWVIPGASASPSTKPMEVSRTSVDGAGGEGVSSAKACPCRGICCGFEMGESHGVCQGVDGLGCVSCVREAGRLGDVFSTPLIMPMRGLHESERRGHVSSSEPPRSPCGGGGFAMSGLSGCLHTRTHEVISKENI